MIHTVMCNKFNLKVFGTDCKIKLQPSRRNVSFLSQWWDTPFHADLFIDTSCCDISEVKK